MHWVVTCRLRRETNWVGMCTALGGEIHGLSGSVVEGESELGEASRAGGKTGGECIAGRLALAVGFEPALHVCPCRGGIQTWPRWGSQISTNSMMHPHFWHSSGS